MDIDWDSKFSGRNLEEMWIIFKETLNELCDIPKLSKSQADDRPLWMDNGVKKVLKSRAWKSYFYCKSKDRYSKFLNTNNLGMRHILL